jgi:hypothetical protein
MPVESGAVSWHESGEEFTVDVCVQGFLELLIASTQFWLEYSEVYAWS